MLGGTSGERFASIHRGVRDLFRSLGGSDSEEGIDGTVLLDPTHLHLIAFASDVSGLLPAAGRPTRLERVVIPVNGANHCVLTVTPTTRELVVEFLDCQNISGAAGYLAYVELLDGASVDPIVIGRTVVAPAPIRSVYAVPTTFEVAYGHQAAGTYPNLATPVAPFFTAHPIGTAGFGAQSSAHPVVPRVPVGHRLVVAHNQSASSLAVNFRISEAVGVPAAL